MEVQSLNGITELLNLGFLTIVRKSGRAAHLGVLLLAIFYGHVMFPIIIADLSKPVER
jgi:hypothetical protein